MLPYLLLGVALLFMVLLAARWFVTADPKTLVLAVKWIGGALAVLVALYLIFSGRAFHMLWLVIFLPFLVRALRGFGGFGRTRPSAGQTSDVETDYLRMVLDHDSGEMSGAVLKGAFAGRELGGMTLDELLDLFEECLRFDDKAAQVLEAYLDRGAQTGWREAMDARQGAAAAGSVQMTADEARDVLGVGARRARRRRGRPTGRDQGGAPPVDAAEPPRSRRLDLSGGEDQPGQGGPARRLILGMSHEALADKPRRLEYYPLAPRQKVRNNRSEAMPQRIRKAVFPVGGLGTRFLPATKAMPKEMLTVVDKPLIHYAVEEAQAAGIEEFIFVTGRGKTAIEDHFDHSYELRETLAARGKTADLEALGAWLPGPGQVAYTRQQEPLGLGHAVWCARALVGDEPFAVLLADDLVLGATPCLKQLCDAWEGTGGNMVAVMEVPREQTNRYGILDVVADDGCRVEASGLIEKPEPEEAPSTVAVIGRYILLPEVFGHLSRQETGAGGEIQLTDAIAAMIGDAPFHGLRFEGERFDCGSRAGFVQANVAFALAREDLRDEVAAFIKTYC